MKNNKIQLPKFLKNRYNVWKATSYLQNEKNIKKLAKLGQKPKAMIISCCDSRVNVSSIFGAKEGDFFIHRNIANIIPSYGSTKTDHSTFAAIEYAIKELKVPYFIILGHTKCGGIKSGYSQHMKDQNKKYKFINSWLSNLHTAYKSIPKKLSIENQINFLEEENVRVSIHNLMQFPIIKKMVKNKKLSIFGLIYDISSGDIKSL